MENKTVEMVVKDLLLADNRKKKKKSGLSLGRLVSNLKFVAHYLRHSLRSLGGDNY